MSNGYDTEDFDEAISTFESDEEGDEEALPWSRSRTNRRMRLDPGPLPGPSQRTDSVSPYRYQTAIRRTESQFNDVSSDLRALNAKIARQNRRLRNFMLTSQIVAVGSAIQALSTKSAKVLDTSSPPNTVEVPVVATGALALIPLFAAFVPFVIGGFSTKSGQAASSDLLTAAAAGAAGGLAANKIFPNK